ATLGGVDPGQGGRAPRPHAGVDRRPAPAGAQVSARVAGRAPATGRVVSGDGRTVMSGTNADDAGNGNRGQARGEAGAAGPPTDPRPTSRGSGCWVRWATAGWGSCGGRCNCPRAGRWP